MTCCSCWAPGARRDAPPVIAGLVATFAPYGFALSAPVLDSYRDLALLAEEVERDIEHGLLTKTAIHPAQVSAIQARYAVCEVEHATAVSILDDASPAVFGACGVMQEAATHAGWATGVLARAAAFGVIDAGPRSQQG